MDLNSINLTSLYYFKIVAERENMTKAAEQLFISQPALSKAILKLEQSLGVTLFERSKGRIHLSAIGAEYYRHISDAFETIEQGNRRIEQLKTESNDKVVIASPISDLLNAMILEFLRDICPSVQISQFLYDPHQSEAKLLAGDLDMVVTPITMESPEITHIKCTEEEVVLVVSRDHPLAGKGAVRLWDVRNEPFLVNESSFDRKIITVHCELVGFTPNITLYSNENSVINRALHYNMGVSLIPGNILYRNRNSMDGLVPLRLTDVEIIRMISVATRKGVILSDNAQKLFHFSCRYFADLGRNISAYLDSILPQVDTKVRTTLGIRNIKTPLNSAASHPPVKAGPEI